MQTAPTAPYRNAEHLANPVLEHLAAQVLEGKLQGTAMLAAARLVCQDQWHQEKLALAEAKLLAQKEKEAAADKYRQRALRIKLKALQIKKKEIAMKRKADLRRSEHEAANDVRMMAPPKIVFEATPPSDFNTALQNKAGIAPGGVVYHARGQSP